MTLDTSYRGYHDPKTLPIKAGDTVMILKGTEISYSFPRPETRKAGRSQRVKVHHVLCGSSMRIGMIYSDGDSVILSHWRDLQRLCLQHGIPVQGPRDDAAFRKLWDLPQAEKRPDDRRPGAFDIWFHLTDPMVVWAGTGGYWRKVNINDVEV